MSKPTHQQAKELFLAVRELPAAARAAYLDDACAGRPALREEVDSLLAHDEDAGDFLEGGVGFVLGADTTPPTVGPYRVLKRIGEGGMGVVYEAEQQSPRRAVALKVLRAGAATPSALRRFEHEVEYLGRLEHRGIARIYDAGRTSDEPGGQPYFAMELVAGRPITDCALDSEERLRLLLDVCDAVQHAHSRGIVHRDLKPENILVGADGAPKILDFGIALALNPDATAGLTQTGLLLGTVQYMSPEQALAMPGEVDARTDVYSLGVIAYELLCGQLPYELTGASPLEALRVIREVEPKPLGTWDGNLGGDLETVLHKALEKDRTQRYASVADFAADIRRYLDDEPILARPAGVGERLGKWARRHRALVIALGIALTGPVFAVLGQAVPAYAALILGLTGTTIGLLRSRRLRREAEAERRVARREADKANAINEFLQQMLASVHSGEHGHDVKVVDLLDQAAERLGASFRSQPEIEGPLRLTLGRSYLGLAQHEAAQAQLELAIELCTRALGPGHLDSLNALGWLSIGLSQQGRHAEAEPLQARLIELRRRFLGEDHPETITSIGQMSWILRALDRKDEAIRNQRAVLDGLLRTRGADHLATVIARGHLASLLGSNDEFEEAEREFRAAIAGMRGAVPAGSQDMLATLSNYAIALHGQKKLDEAEPVYVEVLETQRTMLGEDHPHTWVTASQYARLLVHTDRAEEGEAMLRRGVEVLNACFGEAHPYAAQAVASHGEALTMLGRLDEAEPLLRRGVEQSQGRRRDIALCHLGRCLLLLGHRDEAREVLEAGYESMREHYPPGNAILLQAKADLAELAP